MEMPCSPFFFQEAFTRSQDAIANEAPEDSTSVYVIPI
jgi:hypothetical protein